MRRGAGRRRAGKLLAAALASLFAAALVLPEADRATLVARGAGRLLARDLDRALEPVSPETSLFAAFDALAGGAAPQTLALRVRIDGELQQAPEIERALISQLNRFAAARHSGAPPLRRAREGAAADLSVELSVASAGERVALSARLERGDVRRTLALEETWALPGRGALVPPLLAICVALALRRVLLALFVGIYAGAALLAADSGSALAAPLRGLWDVFAVYFLHELTDTFRIEIIGFIVALIAMVGVTSRAGGVRGLLERMLALARSARSALLLTWGMGLLIFFDDYANCMLVGSTMRPLTDRLRISREKLAYIVDSTAAPVAGISLLSTWIAFLVSLYSPQLPEVGIADSGYAVFVETLPFRFYCLFTLLFVFLLAVTGRDFGPMARAEARARSTGELIRAGGRAPISNALAHIEPAPGMPLDWRFAAAPVAVTLLVILVRIFADGGGLDLLLREPGALLQSGPLTDVLLGGSGVGPIFAGAVSGLLCAIFLAGSRCTRWAVVAGVALAAAFGSPASELLASGLGQASAGYAALLLLFGAGAAGAGALASGLGVRTQRPYVPWPDLRRAAAGSAGTLVFAVVLLFEAWMIGAVCRDLSTADYLVALLSDALPPQLLPVLLFCVACLVAFATGSSWSTMSILVPNVVALAAGLGEASALGSRGMVLVCISAVLEGSIFGDHCSPISDTTVLSSVASSSDHIDHVRTQVPYALATAAVAVACGYLPLLLLPGWPAALALLAGAASLAALLAVFGRRAPDAPTPACPG
ncbi:MAG TPA: Na+/H+ antiporter NhaC family protein [Myxococcota bacterium]